MHGSASMDISYRELVVSKCAEWAQFNCTSASKVAQLGCWWWRCQCCDRPHHLKALWVDDGPAGRTDDWTRIQAVGPRDTTTTTTIERSRLVCSASSCRLRTALLIALTCRIHHTSEYSCPMGWLFVSNSTASIQLNIANPKRPIPI